MDEYKRQMKEHGEKSKDNYLEMCKGPPTDGIPMLLTEFQSAFGVLLDKVTSSEESQPFWDVDVKSQVTNLFKDGTDKELIDSITSILDISPHIHMHLQWKRLQSIEEVDEGIPNE